VLAGEIAGVAVRHSDAVVTVAAAEAVAVVVHAAEVGIAARAVK